MLINDDHEEDAPYFIKFSDWNHLPSENDIHLIKNDSFFQATDENLIDHIKNA